jgi:hypothetical protein
VGGGRRLEASRRHPPNRSHGPPAGFGKIGKNPTGSPRRLFGSLEAGKALRHVPGGLRASLKEVNWFNNDADQARLSRVTQERFPDADKFQVPVHSCE